MLAISREYNYLSQFASNAYQFFNKALGFKGYPGSSAVFNERAALFDLRGEVVKQVKAQYMMAIFSPDNVITILGIGIMSLPAPIQPRILGIAAESSNIVLARFSGILRAALRGKGNFGVGSATKAEAVGIGKAWVGRGYTTSSSNTSILISRDGLRQFRPPSYKPKLGKTQANLQWRNRPSGEWQGNGHLNITN